MFFKLCAVPPTTSQQRCLSFMSIQLHHSLWWKGEAGHAAGVSSTPLLSPSHSALVVFITSALPTGSRSISSLCVLMPGSLESRPSQRAPVQLYRLSCGHQGETQLQGGITLPCASSQVTRGPRKACNVSPVPWQLPTKDQSLGTD